MNLCKFKKLEKVLKFEFFFHVFDKIKMQNKKGEEPKENQPRKTSRTFMGKFPSTGENSPTRARHFAT